ncbi:cilia- and flagella-associated protein 410-like [Hydractinia symbiolongicarpus]|uniref:cilia- and flagella-associated protein 410-like n=1 Tax=Hydractinia symbiolongicarpus TaxID=13093 RepID=UPI00254FB10F|nr:cilia- and flagella-associated protein 410-like [Hydractinia symbiolongicarpus]
MDTKKLNRSGERQERRTPKQRMSLTEKQSLGRSHASCLAHVKNLNCWGSNISDISIVRQMVNLEVLNLSVNNVLTLKDLSFCPKLKELYLRKNQIQTMKEITYLKNLTRLKAIWLEDNPCVKTSLNYRETILRNLPSLSKIDNIEVTEDELRLAMDKGELFEDDLTLPTFDELDLNHTLSPDDVLRQISLLNSNDEEKPSISENDEIPCIEHNATELDLSLGVSCSIDANQDDDDANQDADDANPSTGNLATVSNENESNTLKAVLLLINDLDSHELRQVVAEASTLISSQFENDSQDLKLVEDVEK